MEPERLLLRSNTENIMAKTNKVFFRECLLAFWDEHQDKLKASYKDVHDFVRRVDVVPVGLKTCYYKDKTADVIDSQVARGAFLGSDVVVSQSRIQSSTFVSEDTYIKNSSVFAKFIGKECTIDLSVIGANSTIGDSCKIHLSELGSNVKVGNRVQIMQSFVDYGCTINELVHNSTIRSNSVVSGDVLKAYIAEDSRIEQSVTAVPIYEAVLLKRNDWFMSLGNIGSRDDYMTVVETRDEKNKPYLLFYIGCHGKGRTVVELIRDIDKSYPEHGNRHRVAYLSMIRFVQTMRAAHWWSTYRYKLKTYALPKF